MQVINSVRPNAEQMAGFTDNNNPQEPIYMVNLLKYKDRAEYADGRNTELTGREAYGLYSAAVTRLLQKFGGGAMFKAGVKRLMLGEVEELWDEIAIAMYPSRQAMLDMMMSDEMQEIGVHRAAGLAGQLNIETIDPKGTWLGDSAWP